MNDDQLPSPAALPQQQQQQQQLSLCTDLPYRDDPASPSQEPPRYEPMHDYLRSRSLASNTPSHGHSQPQAQSQPQLQAQEYTSICPELYRDDPDPPPPPYSEPSLYWRRGEEPNRDRDEDGDEGGNGDRERWEEMVRWVVAMLLICLTVAAVGTAFDWGRD